MFGSKRKAKLVDLAVEAGAYGEQQALTVVNKVLQHTGRTAPADVDAVKAGLREFYPRWVAAAGLLAERMGSPDAAAIGRAMKALVQTRYEDGPAGLADAVSVLDDEDDPDGLFGRVAEGVFAKAYPSFGASPGQVAPLAGIELVSSVRYVDHLCRTYKVV